MTERRRVLKSSTGEVTVPGSIDLDSNFDDSITSITVHYPEESYAPVQYNTFRVGGHSITVVPRPGESASRAYMRGWNILAELVEKEFEHRLASFRERLKRTKGE